MSLTRNQIKEILSTAGVDSDHMDKAIEAIIDGHDATVGALKEERDTYKKQAAELPQLQEKLKEFEKDGNPFEEKYNKIKTEYDDYKKNVTAKETKAKKQEAYRALLKEAGVDEKRHNAIIRVTDLSNEELDKDGKFKNADKLKEGIKNDWSDFVVEQSVEGTKTATPPAGKGENKTMTKEDIMKIKDTSERQAKIAENHELFGF